MIANYAVKSSTTSTSARRPKILNHCPKILVAILSQALVIQIKGHYE